MSLRDRWHEHRVIQEELPFYRRSGFLAAAVFVGVVMLAGVVLLLTLGDDGENTATPPGGQVPPVTESPTEATATTAPPTDNPTSTTPPPADSTTAPPVAGGCEPLPTDSGDAALTTAPEVEWAPVGDIAVASSAEAGPAQTVGIAACYSQDPSGALLAAHNFFANVNDPGKDAAEVIETRVVPGATRDALVAELAQNTGGAAVFSPVGYRFVEWSDEATTLRVVYQSPGSTGALYIELTVTLEWVNGDWWVTSAPPPEQVNELPAGYTAWGPLTDAPE